MDRPIIIDEKRGINISLGVLLHFVFTVSALTACYVSIRQELSAATEQGKRNEVQIQIMQQLLDKARMDVGGVSVKFDQFLDSYNRDMNKYVRESGDRR